MPSACRVILRRFRSTMVSTCSAACSRSAIEMYLKSCKDDAPSDSLALVFKPISSQIADTALDSPADVGIAGARTELLCTCTSC
eukprot:5382333-Amphidinium_carterae.1